MVSVLLNNPMWHVMMSCHPWWQEPRDSREGRLMMRRTLRILTVASWVLCCLSPHWPRLSHVTCLLGGGEWNVWCLSGINGRYSEGPPPGPASRVCVCVEVTEASTGDHCPLAPSHLIMLRPVLKIADMSSFYAQAYVNLVLPAPPTGPADTLVLAKSSQNTDTQDKIHLSVNCSQVNKQLGPSSGERCHYFVIILSQLIVIMDKCLDRAGLSGTNMMDSGQWIRPSTG